MENPDTLGIDKAQYEIDMLTVCYLFDKMPYDEAVVAARREHQEIKAMEIEGGLWAVIGGCMYWDSKNFI